MLHVTVKLQRAYAQITGMVELGTPMMSASEAIYGLGDGPTAISIDILAFLYHQQDRNKEAGPTID